MKKALDAGCEKKRVIKAYPAKVTLMCAQSRIADSKRLAASLLKHHSEGIISSRLIEHKRYYLSLLVKTSLAPNMLPDICENSEKVFIGNDYEAIFSEHGRVIIPCSAIEALCQK